jgi:hypothetical protein
MLSPSATSDALGSVSKMYDLLTRAAVTTPVEGNQDGSYLTMSSNQGLVFGAATILSGFSGVFCDQGKVYDLQRSAFYAHAVTTGYWQRVRLSLARVA